MHHSHLTRRHFLKHSAFLAGAGAAARFMPSGLRAANAAAATAGPVRPLPPRAHGDPHPAGLGSDGRPVSAEL